MYREKSLHGLPPVGRLMLLNVTETKCFTENKSIGNVNQMHIKESLVNLKYFLAQVEQRLSSEDGQTVR